MSQSEKSAYFQALKANGVNFDRHYRQYTTEELKAAYVQLTGGELVHQPPAAAPAPASVAPPEPAAAAPADPEAAAFFGFTPPAQPAGAPSVQLPPAVPVRAKDPNEMAGQRQSEDMAPIRTDDEGRVWFQEEVRKPAYPKPRGRRVLRYSDPGVVEQTVQVGKYTETFEVPGDPRLAREAEVKITLPSYQVGIYKDPRFPFKVITYNENEGFDLADVQDYYGGSELVPAEVKRKYVENVLCYDIRTVVRAIETEYRTRVLGQPASL